MGDEAAVLEAQADRAASHGDLASARDLLEQVVTLAPDRIDSWLKLGAIKRANGNISGALAAVSGALRVDPLHFMALMSRARLLEDGGHFLESGEAYGWALAQAPEGEMPAGLAGLIRHARERHESFRNSVGARWDAAIDRDAALTPQHRARLERFKTNALRRTRVYHCEPSHYHYPGLVEREFHDREDFPWLSVLEGATSEIRAEFEALRDARSAQAEPYVQYNADAPVRQWAALNHSLDWTAFHLLKRGERVAANADRCPRTMAVLAEIEQPVIGGRSPNAMFSFLKPRTRIPPHTGVANTRLVCHLPLIVPEKCWFRVGAETREWDVGKAWVFDDTIEHEAANDSDEPRIILIIDTWHPGLSASERAAVARAMEADDAPAEDGL